MAWRLLLTRPVEECAAQAEELASRGIASSCMPLLAIEPVPETPEQRAAMQDLERYGAVVVVSKPAARLGLALLDRYWSEPPAGLPWFSVGAATGQLLAAHGLRVHYPDPGQGDDSEALLAVPALQAALAAAATPRVLILRGEGGREFLGQTLQAQGAAVDFVALYRRRLPDYPVGELAARVRAQRLNGVVVTSGQGLQHLLELAGDDWSALARLPLFVPSPRVAEQARRAGAQRVVDCRGASTAALLATLEQIPVATL